MFKLIRFVGMVLAVGTILTGCTTFEERVAQTYPNGVSIVELSDASPLRVEGQYDENDVSFRFLSETKDGASMVSLASQDGSPFVIVEASESRVIYRIFDDEEFVQIEHTGDRDCDDLTRSQIAALERISESPVYRALPKLSRSLAMLNVTGRDYPAALPLHLWGLSSERLHGPPTGPPDGGEDRVPMMYANPYASKIVKIAIEHHELVDEIYGCKETAGPFTPPETAEAIAEACNLGPTCEVEADPNDDCHGQCGIRCDCWKWVCGDCCVNKACEIHDEFAIDCALDGEFNGSEIGSCPLAILGIPAAPLGIPTCAITGWFN